jgi:hypothetical protein
MFVNFYKVKLFELNIFVCVFVLYILLNGYLGSVDLC